MGDRDDLPYIVIERHDSGVLPFVWGALIGAAAALLLAPRSGNETQREIRERVFRLRDDAEQRVDDARGAVASVVERARDRVVDRIDSVRDVVQARAAQARDAVETGRQAAREARSELEDRIHEAKRAVQGDGGELDPLAGAEIDIIVTDVIIEEPRPDLS
jgi:gas vesicle protein